VAISPAATEQKETAKNITTEIAREKTSFCMQNHIIRREKTSNANSGQRRLVDFQRAGAEADQHHLLHRLVSFQKILRLEKMSVPLMTVVVCFKPEPIRRWTLVVAVALALCTLAAIILIQIPIHQQLGSIGYTSELLGRLRKTDLLRQ
jgi:hypothetical protein